MINLERSLEAPASLDTPEIQNYINLAVANLADPIANPKPEKPATYRNSDLLQAFDEQFLAKCYLTEEKFQSSWEMDVEHFVGQCERGDLVYAWPNLFPCAHNANLIKPRRTPLGGYLNPCEPDDDVETAIVYSLSVMGDSPKFSPADVLDTKAINTASLLNRVHNGHDVNTTEKTKGLRHAIHKKYIEILNKIIEWQGNEGQEKAQAERELRDLLSRQSAFTMLCRSIPAVRQTVIHLFD